MFQCLVINSLSRQNEELLQSLGNNSIKPHKYTKENKRTLKVLSKTAHNSHTFVCTGIHRLSNTYTPMNCKFFF